MNARLGGARRCLLHGPARRAGTAASGSGSRCERVPSVHDAARCCAGRKGSAFAAGGGLDSRSGRSLSARSWPGWAGAPTFLPSAAGPSPARWPALGHRRSRRSSCSRGRCRRAPAGVAGGRKASSGPHAVPADNPIRALAGPTHPLQPASGQAPGPLGRHGGVQLFRRPAVTARKMMRPQRLLSQHPWHKP